ncbi:MAG TPA: dihydrodipicolinate synthase family protein [Casimicrobiaceae bacterium]|jgi:4-hydroxy-tetrahydrodipicolinate synthase|nr:dihydrodipicolinate synthase family protein [Casimicrobiaceae bacterium]
MHVQWQGVIPALTTPFDANDRIDEGLLAEHARWVVDNGCTGLVPIGSLGESATLSAAEKRRVLAVCVGAVGDRVPVIPGIAALGTAEAVALARDAKAAGASGLMVLPPYVYSTDWREMKAHVRAVIAATDLPCMLYNNPVAYRTDFVPAQIAELAREVPNLRAVKESSTDVRRTTAIRALLGERIDVLCGVDDAIVEAVGAGAAGWIAGLVNAFPVESVALFRYAAEGRRDEAFALYRWFLPLLRMDTVPKFVQLIKLAQKRVGMGSDRVRAPRLPLEGTELRDANAILDEALATRPALDVRGTRRAASAAA